MERERGKTCQFQIPSMLVAKRERERERERYKWNGHRKSTVFINSDSMLMFPHASRC